MERLVKGDFGDGSEEETSGEIFSVLFALKHLADQVGITQVLGTAAESKHNLFLILAHIAHGGSRLSAERWAQQHAVASVLGVDGYEEDDRYAALDWLASQQERIARDLYQAHVKQQGQPPVWGCATTSPPAPSKRNVTRWGGTVTTATASGASHKSSSRD